MKTFKELYEACCAACEKRAEIEEVKEPTGDLKDACWKGYTAVGMKMKNGRKVPNCVPVKEEAEQIDENLMMAAAASANQPKYTERTAEQEKKHAERKAEKYLHMPGKNAAKKRKYWVKKVNKLHGIPEEFQIDEAADMKTLRKQLAKHTELAVQANKAGDDALTKKHQGHINKIKERMTKVIKEQIDEATYQGKEVPLNKPMAGDVKKSKVYVDPDGDGKAQKVNFGDKNMTIKKHIPGRRKNFRARHNCDNPGPKTKARYWSCKKW